MRIVQHTGKESSSNSSSPPLLVSPFRWSTLLFHLLPLPYHSMKFLSRLELNHNSSEFQKRFTNARWHTITATIVKTRAKLANPSPLSSLKSNIGKRNGARVVWKRFWSSTERFTHVWDGEKEGGGNVWWVCVIAFQQSCCEAVAHLLKSEHRFMNSKSGVLLVSTGAYPRKDFLASSIISSHGCSGNHWSGFHL